MTTISRRAILKGIAATPLGAHAAAEQAKMSAAGLAMGITPAGTVAGREGQSFLNFASWLKAGGDDAIQREADQVWRLDPDLVEMRLPMQTKVRMQRKRNYAHVLAYRQGWFARELTKFKIVKCWL